MDLQLDDRNDFRAAAVRRPPEQKLASKLVDCKLTVLKAQRTDLNLLQQAVQTRGREPGRVAHGLQDSEVNQETRKVQTQYQKASSE